MIQWFRLAAYAALCAAAAISQVQAQESTVKIGVLTVALAVQEVARDKKKVILINGAASSDLTGSAPSRYRAANSLRDGLPGLN